MAETLDELVAALSGALRQDPRESVRLREFVRAFVRPAGLDVAATPRLVDAIEDLGSLETAPERVPLRSHLLRTLLVPLTAVVRARPQKVRSVRKPTSGSTVADERRAGAGA
jgi:hypothetical protein